MKGILITEAITPGRNVDPTIVERILVPSANDLTITPHKGELLVSMHYAKTSDTKIIGEIEVPDEVVEEAIKMFRARFKLDEKYETVKNLIETRLNAR